MGFLYSQFFVTPPLPTTSLAGQTHIITGSNTGLGFAAATHIARLNPSRLILAVRNLTSGATARDNIISTSKIDPSVVQVWHLDMSFFTSVLSFADRCTRDLDRVDGISLNAGIQTGTFEVMEGYESTITVNVISTFLLFFAMLPLLKSSAKKHDITPRISIVSSETHGWAPFRERDTPSEESIFSAMSTPDIKNGVQHIDRFDQYGNSKLVQVLMFRHICPLLKKHGYGDVAPNILNPGLCYSDIGRDESLGIRIFKFFMMAVLARSQEVGGRTLALALMPNERMDGQYLSDGVVSEEAVSEYAKSEEGRAMGERLWKELRLILEKARPGLTAGC